MSELAGRRSRLLRVTPSQIRLTAPIKQFLPRGLIVLASLAIAAFVFLGCRALWREWVLLQDAVADVQATAPVGLSRHRARSFLRRPPGNLIRQEGNETLLWSRWENGVGHHWFHFCEEISIRLI